MQCQQLVELCIPFFAWILPNQYERHDAKSPQCIHCTLAQKELGLDGGGFKIIEGEVGESQYRARRRHLVVFTDRRQRTDRLLSKFEGGGITLFVKCD